MVRLRACHVSRISHSNLAISVTCIASTRTPAFAWGWRDVGSWWLQAAVSDRTVTICVDQAEAASG